MNSNNTKVSWEEQKLKLKQKFDKLVAIDVLFFDNKKEEIIAKLQVKLGKSKIEIEQLLKDI